MLTVLEVQSKLGLPEWHEDYLAEGYSIEFPRFTITVYIENGSLIREEWNGDKLINKQASYFFDPSFFTSGVKRLYRRQTNAMLVEWFETFGTPLPMIN